MRTLVLILMIVLLPVRAWAAEGMAVRMAHEQVPASAMAAREMPPDCPMMAQAGAEQGSPADEHMSTSHCVTCHLCAATACLPAVALEPGAAPTGPPGSTAEGYPSAFLAPHLRPPIA